MKLIDAHKRAMRAVAQWKLGDRGWATIFIAVVESDDPISTAERWLDGETVDGLIGSGDGGAK